MPHITMLVVVAALVLGLGVAPLIHAGSSKSSSKNGVQMDTKPGPAFKTIEGKVNKIDGDIYVVEEYTGNQLRVYVGKETKKLKGNKKPGDTIRAEVTRGGYANSIQ